MAWGHEAGIDEVGIVRWSMLGRHGGGVAAKCGIDGGANVEWGSGAGGAGGRGKHECGWVEVSGGGRVSW